MNLFYVSSRRTFDQKKQQEKLFIHIEQQTRTERKDDRKKKLNTHSHTELFIQWIKCRHRWLDSELHSLFVRCRFFFFLSYLKK